MKTIAAADVHRRCEGDCWNDSTLAEMLKSFLGFGERVLLRSDAGQHFGPSFGGAT